MSKQIDAALRAAENYQTQDVGSKFSARMKAAAEDMGHPGSLRHQILSLVASENYEKAQEDLKAYVESKVDYPEFVARSKRYCQYAGDLIHAVKAKRSFPGMQYLAMSKQQELIEKALEHFNDLKVTLKKIETIERTVHVSDIRSTVWVVQAVIYCAFALLVIGFISELSKGLLPSAGILFEDATSRFVNWFFDLVGM